MTTHVEDFAGRLRELKERSGRSYGQLAARLHVSTSSLHRYCNGAAVPVDYAPVERFARLCGATPEELLTLHRCWVLAEATRRETDRPGEARAAALTEEGEGAAAEPAGEEPSGEPAPSGEPGPSGEPAPDSDVTAEPGGPAGGPPRRARRTALVVGAAVAIAAVAVLPVALHGRGDGARDAGSASPAPAAHTRTPAPRTATTNPPATTAPATPTAPAATAPATTAAAPGTGPAPFQVNVMADNWNAQCGAWFLMPQQPGKVPPPPSLEQTNAWAAALGGVPAGHLRLELTAQSGAAQPVVLHALYVHVVSSRPAAKGNVYTPGSGCGGPLAPAYFAVDLDARAPRTTPVRGLSADGTTVVLSKFPYRISATDDPQVLDVDATTADRDVSWYLELAWSSGDRSGKVTVDDHGRPFRTLGLKGDPAYFYDGESWAPASADD